MEEFLRSYGLWILLGAVFVVMQWFGGGCGASHRRPRVGDGQADPDKDDRPAHAGPRGGCH